MRSDVALSMRMSQTWPAPCPSTKPRLPVLNRDKRLVGIISLGDVAVMESPDAAAAAISGISEPGGEHSQTGGPRT